MPCRRIPWLCTISVAVLGATLHLAAPPAAGQSGPASSEKREVTAAGLPLVRAVRVEGAPEIDGDVLGDPMWDAADPTTGFRQSTPNEGQPASERTEVRIVYNGETLYVGVICYVRDPGTIIVSDSRRDTPLNETDSFRIIIDTYRDSQNGFVFGTNPAGLELDGQVTNAGQGSGRGGGGGRPGQQRGSGGGLNLNWDGAWQVSASISEIGWSAEFAIPFRTLRYPSGEGQTWGVNFQRNIRHSNEESFWAPLPRQFNLYRLSLAGEVQGLQVPAQRNLKLTPYALGEAVRRESDVRTTAFGDVGADLKYSVTPSLTMDLTLNTDFAQVEVDEEQINLDRFNLFFPEKRPFFLENAGLFSVGLPGQVEVFFSRRIGIGDSGQQIPIIGGGRLSGKIGNNTNIGFLNMQAQSLDETLTPSNNFTVARVRQDFVNRSNIGAIFVNRQATGHLAGDRDFNRSYAVDGRLGIGQEGTISGFVAGTQTPDVKGDTHAYNLTGEYDTESYRVTLGYTEVGPNFNPEVGFYSRRGYQRANALVFTTFRPENFIGMHEIRPHVSHYTIWNFDTGQQESQFTHIDTHWEWQNGYEVHTGVNVFKEGVLEPFEIFPDVIVPAGTYDDAEAQLVAHTNRGAPFSVSFNTIFGGFFGGDRVQLRPQATLRVGEAFNAQLSWTRNDINLPAGSFVANLGQLRVNYSFTTRTFVQALVQYNDSAPLLDEAESDRVIEITRSLVPRDRLLIAGVGRESTTATITAARRAAALGADAVLVRTPSFFKRQLTTDAFALHYTAVADASPAPVILYNITAFTGVTLSVEAVARIATHANIIGMKESSGDIGTLSAVVDQTPDEFSLLAGSAPAFYASLLCGAVGGVLAVACVVPHLCVDADPACASGDPRARRARSQSGAFARRIHRG